MNKLLLVFVLVLLVPSAFGIQLVKDSEIDVPYQEDPFPPEPATDFPFVNSAGNWSFTHTWGYFIGGPAEVAILSGTGTPWEDPPGPGETASTSTASLWQNTGEVFRPDTVYTYTIRWYDGPENQGQVIDIDSIHCQIMSVTGGTFTDLVDLPDTPVEVSVWQDFSFQYDTTGDPDSVVGTDIGVGFRLTEATGSWVHVDFIELTHPSATNPSPPHDTDTTDDVGEVGTVNGSDTIDVTLGWDAIVSPVATNHYLYLQENDPNFLGATPFATIAGGTTTYDLTLAAGRDLNPGSAYFWRIDEGTGGSGAGDLGTIPGDMWAFETLSVIPIVTDHPDDRLDAVGDVTAFEVTAIVPGAFPITGYEWFLSLDDAEDTPGDDVSIGTGNPSSHVAVLADAGKFAYCAVTNSKGTTNSEPALLEVKRLLGHWDMDGDFASTPPGQTGTAVFSSFAGGMDGSAVDLPNDPNNVIGILGSETAYNNFHLGLSIGMWVKTSYAGDWQILAGKQDRAAGDTGWSLNLNALGNVNLAIGETAISTASINDDAWHLVIATFDGVRSRIYIDGLLETTSNPLATAITRANMNSKPFEIGGESATGIFSTLGLLDDVKIHNYALHPSEVLDAYNAFAAVKLSACVASYASNLDTSGPLGVPDCMITLHDFADYFSKWLSDGCYGVPGTYPCDM